MKRALALVLCTSALGGCLAEAGDEADDDVEEITEDLESASGPRVTRLSDGAFQITTATAARVADCTGACVDADGDGLVDAWETAVLDRLRPAITFDEDEPLMAGGNADPMGMVGRVFPSGGSKVVASFLLLYGRDYGVANPLCFSHTHHPGDAERAALELEIVGKKRAIARAAYTTGHEGTKDDQTRIFRGTALKTLESVKDSKTGQARWRVYASQKKHATYATKSLCENAKFSSFAHQFCGQEDCGADVLVGSTARFTQLLPIVNSGEKNKPMANDLGRLGARNGGRGFVGERVWGSPHFCGGREVANRDDCPGSLEGKLLRNPFAGR
jgi:hypothetical protein